MEVTSKEIDIVWFLVLLIIFVSTVRVDSQLDSKGKLNAMLQIYNHFIHYLRYVVCYIQLFPFIARK